MYSKLNTQYTDEKIGYQILDSLVSVITFIASPGKTSLIPLTQNGENISEIGKPSLAMTTVMNNEGEGESFDKMLELKINFPLQCLVWSIDNVYQ